jgi:hypothetical protein
VLTVIHMDGLRVDRVSLRLLEGDDAAVDGPEAAR